MLAEARRQHIIELLEQKNVITVSELSQLLNTTETTIRRDLELLQNQNMLNRIHGGAMLPRPKAEVTPLSQLEEYNTQEKRRIAGAAYKLIRDGDTIILDVSTTVLELVKLIAEGNRQNISIITNSFTIVDKLRECSGIRVIHTGGQMSAMFNCSLGMLAENAIRGLRVDKCFLGVNGIEANYGYSTPTFEFAAVKKAIISASQTSIVLSDHTKFGATYMGKFAEFNGVIQYLVTDMLPKEYERLFAGANTKVIIAP